MTPTGKAAPRAKTRATAPILLVETIPDPEMATPPAPPGSPVDILARTLWGEGRSEPVRAQEALAVLVLNRTRRAQQNGGRYWWGDSIQQVCLKPWQFPCWNPGHPDRARLLAVGAADRRFRICLRIARRAIAGALDDPTQGATHYHTRFSFPPWARDRLPTAEIGGLLFYNDVE